MNIKNSRGVNENFKNFKERLKLVNKAISLYLKRGVAATESKDEEKYIPGPHPKHKPHKVKAMGFAMGPAGAPKPHEFVVTHPGTLVKEKK